MRVSRRYMHKALFFISIIIIIFIVQATAVFADRNITVTGCIEFMDDSGVPIRADSVTVEIKDRDIDFNDDLASTRTDGNGCFTTSFTWEECYFCENDPDIYYEYITKNGAVTVESDWFEVDFKYMTYETTDFSGTYLDKGTLNAEDSKHESDVRPLNIHTTITRAWRWLYENPGYNTPHVDVQFTGRNDFYNAYWDEIYITGSPGGWNESIHAHEYGHHWMHNFAYYDKGLGIGGGLSYNNEYCDGGFGYGHCEWCEENDARIAYLEGWRGWFADFMIREQMSRYGLALNFDSFEELCRCIDSEDYSACECNPRFTEGFLAAMLRDIEDANPDDHGICVGGWADGWLPCSTPGLSVCGNGICTGDGIKDALALGWDEIFTVTVQDDPHRPMEFLNRFMTRFPQHKENLWATAKNVGYELDEAPPNNPDSFTMVAAPSTAGDNQSYLPYVYKRFSWNRPDDEASGVYDYSISLTKDAPVMPPSDSNDPLSMVNATSYTNPQPLEPGNFYMNVRALDRSGKWANSYSSYGPVAIHEPLLKDSNVFSGDSAGAAVSWADYDNDGDQDLYVVNQNISNRLYRNNGNGTFWDVTPPPLNVSANGRTAVWADYDNNGYLDLYVVNNGAPNRLFRNNGNGLFTDVSAVPLNYSGNSTSASWADYNGDGFVDLYLVKSGAANSLFRNNGNGTFSEMTSSPLSDAGAGVVAVWGDYDRDGDPDLYLANWCTLGRLFRNDGSGSFTSVDTSPINNSVCATDAAWGDFDNDGDLDLYLAAGGSGNRLYRNDGSGSFSLLSLPLRNNKDYGRDVTWLDYDLDGRLDLFVTNASAHHRLIRNIGGILGWGLSEDVTHDFWPLDELNVSAWADMDGDGDPDPAGRGGVYRLDMPPSGHHWMQVRLQGSCSNASGIGARIRVQSGDR